MPARPIRSTYASAAPRPAASPMEAVPASNRAGGGSYVVRSKVTFRIMLPPPCHGGIESSTSAFPYRAPMPVDQDASARSMRGPDDLADRDDRPQGVGHVPDRDQPGPVREERAVLVEEDLAAVVDRYHAQRRAALLGEKLPWHDVGVMLQAGDHDLIPGAHICAAPALRDEVDRLGRAADEDDVLA